MEVLQQVSQNLRQAELDTFDLFISALYECFDSYWINPPDFPVAVSISELNEFYTSEAIDAAVSYFLEGPHDEDLDQDLILDWGNQQETLDPEDEYEIS